MSASYSRDPARPLTPRMREILAAAAAGEAAKVTAARLNLSIHTVRDVRVAARQRLGAATLTAATITADRAGLL